MLHDYMETVAKRLKNGTHVYLSPACMETVLLAKMLKNQYGVWPAGFCDNDTRKQGKHLNSIPELEISSFDQALSDPASEFLVVSPHHSAQIMGGLVFDKGVSEKRIINFQPMERVKTCGLFAQNWIVEDSGFVCCCVPGHPHFFNDSLDPMKSVRSLDKTRLGLIEQSVPLPDICVGCHRNTDCYIFVSRKLNSFDFSFRGWCNYKCKYCSSNQPGFKDYNDRFLLEQYITALESEDMINDIFSVLFAVGEPTLNEKRLPLYDYCRKKQYFMDVFSNCSTFDKELFDLARVSPVIIRKSFDAGTAETYARIKGVPGFSKMLDNLHRYLEAPYLALNPKYLFVPEVNDNETDVREFVKLCVELKVDFVTPVFSFLDDQYTSSAHAQSMFKLLVDELARNNIFTANVDTLYSESYHKLYTKSF